MSFLNCVDMLMAEVLCLYVFSSKVEKLLNCVFRNSLLLLCLQMLVTVLESTNPSDHCVFLGLEVYANPRAGWFELQCSTGWDGHHLISVSTDSNYM